MVHFLHMFGVDVSNNNICMTGGTLNERMVALVCTHMNIFQKKFNQNQN